MDSMEHFYDHPHCYWNIESYLIEGAYCDYKVHCCRNCHKEVVGNRIADVDYTLAVVMMMTTEDNYVIPRYYTVCPYYYYYSSHHDLDNTPDSDVATMMMRKKDDNYKDEDCYEDYSLTYNPMALYPEKEGLYSRNDDDDDDDAVVVDFEDIVLVECIYHVFCDRRIGVV